MLPFEVDEVRLTEVIDDQVERQGIEQIARNGLGPGFHPGLRQQRLLPGLQPLRDLFGGPARAIDDFAQPVRP